MLGIHSHSVRHLLKGTLLVAGCAPYAADHILGHSPRDGYGRQAVLYPEAVRREYAKASALLNVFTRVELHLDHLKDGGPDDSPVGEGRRRSSKPEKARRTQKVTDPEGADEVVAGGWGFVATLPNGRVVEGGGRGRPGGVRLYRGLEAKRPPRTAAAQPGRAAKTVACGRAPLPEALIIGRARSGRQCRPKKDPGPPTHGTRARRGYESRGTDTRWLYLAVPQCGPQPYQMRNFQLPVYPTHYLVSAEINLHMAVWVLPSTIPM